MILALLFLPFMGFATNPYGEDVTKIVIEKGGQPEKKPTRKHVKYTL